ncbi:Ger(x)C family spore germination protein [Cohnella panacarvi]|uniref:Ger(x)C family spore germination protein n=1 Tax=Cohnella panacarvi TaxID=400776 RepID=UPI000478AA80|nr:Ger(x)C family spore germination protein [Cohnella panacarvi]
MSLSARLLRRIALVCVICLMLPGCWDRKELNQIAITSATGIDYKDGQWIVSYQVVIPSAISAAMTAVGGGAAKLPVIVYSTQGKTIREAVWKSALESPRRLFFSHTRVLVVSAAATQQGLTPLIDVYLRNPDSRETVNVLISDGEARTILEQLMQIQIIPGDGIHETMVGEARDLSILPSIKMYDLAMELLGSAKSSVLPEIVVSGSPGVTSAEALNKTALSSKLRLGRLAVLGQDKLVGWLSRQEAIGVGFMRDKMHMTSISFACNADSREEESAFRLMKSKTRLTPHKSGNSFVMDIKVEGEGTLLETNCPLDLNKPNTIDAMEEQLEKKIAADIEESWRAVKKLKTDVVGFADRIHRKYPKEWKKLASNWEATFLQIEIRPEVDITIKRTGLSTKSYMFQTEKE